MLLAYQLLRKSKGKYIHLEEEVALWILRNGECCLDSPGAGVHEFNLDFSSFEVFRYGLEKKAIEYPFTLHNFSSEVCMGRSIKCCLRNFYYGNICFLPQVVSYYRSMGFIPYDCYGREILLIQ